MSYFGNWPNCIYVLACSCSVHEKSAFYTKMRQMRLAMRECHAASTAIIETQNKARKKLNRDLLKAKEVLKNLEELKYTQIPVYL